MAKKSKAGEKTAKAGNNAPHTIGQWQSLQSTLQLLSKMTPVKQSELDKFEEERGVKLPTSYRNYCLVFGAGQIANAFTIAVPKFRGEP